MAGAAIQQQVAVITLGTADLSRSRRFYCEGFGWVPVFENPEIIFYQMNGFVLGTFLTASLEADMNRSGLRTPGAFSLAHNVSARERVAPVMQALVAAGGRSDHCRDRCRPRTRQPAGAAGGGSRAARGDCQ